MEIPTRGEYAPIKTGSFHAVCWRYAGNQKVLVQFLGPNAAAAISRALNYGVPSQLQTAWDYKEPSRIIRAPGFLAVG